MTTTAIPPSPETAIDTTHDPLEWVRKLALAGCVGLAAIGGPSLLMHGYCDAKSRNLIALLEEEDIPLTERLARAYEVRQSISELVLPPGARLQDIEEIIAELEKQASLTASPHVHP